MHLLDSKDHKRLQNKFEQVLAGKNVPIFELKYRPPHGNALWVEVDLKAIRKNKKIIGVLGISREITGRKHAEEALKRTSAHLEEGVEGRTAALRESNKRLKEEIKERKRAELKLMSSERKYRDLYEGSRDGYALVDLKDRIIEFNSAFREMLGYATEEELRGKQINEITASRWHAAESKIFEEEVHRYGYSHLYEKEYLRKDGTPFPIELRTYLVRDDKGRPTGMWAWVRDITERKLAEQELEIKTHNLQEVNTALRVLLKEREADKRENDEKIVANVKALIAPYLEKLRNSSLNSAQIAYLDILESNLNEIVSPFTSRLSSTFINLTPTEIRVANLVKEGKSTKEIATVMNVSARTVESHRGSIRKKMGVNEEKRNLRSYLLTVY